MASADEDLIHRYYHSGSIMRDQQLALQFSDILKLLEQVEFDLNINLSFDRGWPVFSAKSFDDSTSSEYLFQSQKLIFTVSCIANGWKDKFCKCNIFRYCKSKHSTTDEPVRTFTEFIALLVFRVDADTPSPLASETTSIDSQSQSQKLGVSTWQVLFVFLKRLMVDINRLKR